jgi:hypothetical protein
VSVPSELRSLAPNDAGAAFLFDASVYTCAPPVRQEGPWLRSDSEERANQVRYRHIRAKRNGNALFGGNDAEISPVGKGIFPSRRARCGSDAPLEASDSRSANQQGNCRLVCPRGSPYKTEALIRQRRQSMREDARRRYFVAPTSSRT